MTLAHRIRAIVSEAEKDLAKEQLMVANGLDYHAHLRNILGHRAFILERLKKALEEEAKK